MWYEIGAMALLATSAVFVVRLLIQAKRTRPACGTCGEEIHGKANIDLRTGLVTCARCRVMAGWLGQVSRREECDGKASA